MIPLRYIQEWKSTAPWTNEEQVEQDLIISRALVEIYASPLLREALAFRGGTALHKLYLAPQPRYSEDIDLVQIEPGPIREVLHETRERLSFLGTKRTVKQHVHNNTVIYRFTSETPPSIEMRLKIEINTREHFCVLGLKQIPFRIDNGWFSGECELTGYELEELLGTKLRALYQRRKGRDLFDLYWALRNREIDDEKILACYRRYMDFVVEQPPSRKQFLANMELKRKDNEFLTDMYAIIRPGLSFNVDEAWDLVRDRLVERL